MAVKFNPWTTEGPRQLGSEASVLLRVRSVDPLQALRRSFGTFLLEAGVDMRTVSQALGHTNTITTERSYLGVVPTLKHDLAARLQVVLSGIVKDTA